MPTTDSVTWSYHDDFARIVVGVEPNIALRLLEAADIALTFARALVAMNYDEANGMLSRTLKLACSPQTLRASLEQMIQYSGIASAWPTGIQVVTATDVSGMERWINKTPEDFGWVYVSIDGDGYCEAVAVMVSEDCGRLVIREIEWGRP